MNLKLLVSLPFVCCAAFSQGSTVPPPVARIVTVPELSTSPLRPYGRAGATVDVLGLVATTGTMQTWTMEMHPTFASIEDLDKALGIPMLVNLTDARAMIATLQPASSCLPDEAMRSLPKARYVRVTIYRIRPGSEGEFDAIARSRKVTAERLDSVHANLFYRVVSGDDAGTYIAISPLASLSVLDGGTADPESSGVSGKEAEIEIGREHYLFRVEPRLSHVSTEFANGDPSFWRP
jgi:hypothetical protein